MTDELSEFIVCTPTKQPIRTLLKIKKAAIIATLNGTMFLSCDTAVTT
ncbi:hypothetical protein ABEW32_25745 [Paenibacillus jamilae]